MGPNLFPNPFAALAAYDFTLPGGSAQRNGIRGDGLFSVDLGLGKQFTLFSYKDHPCTPQLRERRSTCRTQRSSTRPALSSDRHAGHFGNYGAILENPHVIQFKARLRF
jgi:hypothetical protein